MINIISGKDFSAYSIIKDELLKIKEFEFIHTDKPIKADINYWLSLGTYGYWRETNKPNKTDLVFFNPYLDWKETSKRIDHCVFQSKSHYETSPIKNKYLIPTGVDLDTFKPKVKIGFVAIQRARKGTKLLSDLLKEGLEDFTFYLCGSRWERFIDEHRKYADIVHIPLTPYNELPKVYNSFDYLLVCTDSEEEEGGPMVMIEALACGKPVITTPVGFANELDVMKYKNLDELKVILKSLIPDRSQIIDYTWDNFRKKHINLFNKLGV